jgi:hypothetical protein
MLACRPPPWKRRLGLGRLGLALVLAAGRLMATPAEHRRDTLRVADAANHQQALR